MGSVKATDIDKIDCKHIVYCESNVGCDDLLVIKESILKKDGTIVPNLRLIKNYKRDFFVTKKRYQQPDSQKKEWEEIRKLTRYSTTQSNLLRSIGKALGRPGAKGNLRMLGRSPFLYGTDVSTPVILKQDYLKNYEEWRTSSSVAILDIETDVVKGHGRPIYGALTFKDKAILIATEEFLGSIVDPKDKLRAMADELLGDILKDRSVKLEIEICSDSGWLCRKLIAKGHEWKPDFIGIWNLDFDIPEIIKTLQYYGHRLEDVFSDPSIPEEFRTFKYKRGQTQKVTVSGKQTPIHYADRWHTVICPSSFYLIDAMCVYKKIRVGAPNETSYSLDAIMKKQISRTKLKFDVADHLTGLEWHVFMQTKYKLEYGIYNLFDCIGLEMLDEKTKDLSTSFPVQAGVSEYGDFNSLPKRLVDSLHFFCMEHDLIIAAVSNDMIEELDKYVVGMKDWIITLPSFLIEDNGLKLIKEDRSIKTMFRVMVNDLDVRGAYPHTEDALNISKETTYREVSKIEGVSDVDRRFSSINLTASHVNATEIAGKLFQAPSLNTLLDEFNREMNT